MKKILQIATFILLSSVFFTMIPVIWLGLFPELSILEYMSRWQVFGTFISTLAVYVGFIAYVFGWNPRNRSLLWIRTTIILPSLTNYFSVSVVLIALVCIQVAGIQFLIHFDKPHAQEVTSLILAENYAGADRELGEANVAADTIAELFFVNDSIRQGFYSTSQNADKELCRMYLNYFRNQNVSFRNAWVRYLFRYAHASCAQVLEASKESLKMYKEAHVLARWIGPDEERRINRKIASVYFYDKHGTTDIKDKKERLRTIISLISSDSNPTAQRMLGVSYYLLEEYAKAAETWNSLLLSIASDQYIEKKVIHNNMAMAYTALHQYDLALNTLDVGINFPYKKDIERERREQIRLLSTKALTLVSNKNCSQAESTWGLRNSLKQQQLSKCTSLLSAQIGSCDANTFDSDKILKDLLIGVGQPPDTFRDYIEPALMALVEQAGKTFKECYLGLTFNSEPIKIAMKSIIGSKKNLAQ